jgi:hypothetical protein
LALVCLRLVAREVLALKLLLALKNLILECLFGLIVEVPSPPVAGLARHRLAAYRRTSQQRGEEFKETIFYKILI